MKSWKKIGKILLFFLICFITWQAETCDVDAAGANISIKTDTSTVTKGDIFYVIITVESTEALNGFEGYFSYNQSVMKYVTGGTVSSGNDDEFSISDLNREESSTELKYSIQFKARKAGSSTIALKSPYGVYGVEDSGKMSVASNILNILVVKKPVETPDIGSGLSDEKESSEKPKEEGIEPSNTPGYGDVDFGKNPEDISKESMEPVEEPVEEPMEESVEEPVEPTEDVVEPSQENANPSEETPYEKDTTVIVFLLLFSVCLLIAIIIGLVSMKKQAIEEEEQWKAEDAWDEDREEEILEETYNSTNEGESLEEIEKRLEKKRYWLRK